MYLSLSLKKKKKKRKEKKKEAYNNSFVCQNFFLCKKFTL